MSIMEGALGLYLGVLSIEDYRRKEVGIISLVIGAVLTVAVILLGPKVIWTDRLVGAAIGIVMLIIHIITRGAIGKADCILFFYLGIGTGFIACSKITIISFSLCCIVCMIRLCFHKVTKKQRIAFIPFLLIGYLCSWR